MGAPTASSLTTHPPLAAGEPVIIILDHEGHIQRFNSACERYTGLREQDVIGKNAFRLFLHHRGGVRVSIRRFYTREDSLKTEIVLHAQAMTMLRAFSHLGARIHLDDFGTGYSSLAQLTRFPFSAVKLDRSMVRNVHRTPQAQSLIKAIIAVASALEMEIIAEGVETPEEDAFITACGIRLRQGFLFARPMTAPQLAEWLAHPA
ncbi:EAL domain-containing protein [Shimwellia pseudoproteus]|nr:EAL domain-containing protein [Shimwellia pseudoproteus]